MGFLGPTSTWHKVWEQHCRQFCSVQTDVAVRTTRARIIHLRNDWKDLMGIIEKRLHEHFASLEDDDTETVAPISSDISIPRDSVPETLDPPFAKVNSVVDNSPAAAAGLQAGDLIRNFGYVNLENNDGLKKVAECVQGNEGVRRRRRILPRVKGVTGLTELQQNILVKVSRSGGGSRSQELRLTLTPRRNWGGRGMLGCHILPL